MIPMTRPKFLTNLLLENQYNALSRRPQCHLWIKGLLLTCLLALEIAALPLSAIDDKAIQCKEIKICRNFMLAPNPVFGRFARIDKSMPFTNHSFLLSYHSCLPLRWFLPCRTQSYRFSVYFNLNLDCYDTYIM